MRIVTVVGNRPQFIKAAAVSGRLRERHNELLVHTGQHHDETLSRVFFDELGLASPDRELGVTGGSNASQATRMLAALAPLIKQSCPDAVLVYGDTNSTLAGALAGAMAGHAVIHVEAGMRSFDRAMPEELNRVLVDHMSSLLLCPSATAVANLAAEGVPAQGSDGWAATGDAQRRGGRAEVVVVGDVMVDLAMRWQPLARANRAVLARYGLSEREYVLLTAHRAGNVNRPQRLHALVRLIAALSEAGTYGPVVFPVHPRTAARLRASGLMSELERCNGVRLAEPLPYAELSALLCHARALLTDSGGMQKEAYLAGIPCVTLRDSTEWVETVQCGWNTLVDLDAGAALEAVARAPEAERLAPGAPGARPALYGDGHASERCVEAIDRLAARADTAASGHVKRPDEATHKPDKTSGKPASPPPGLS